MVGHRIVRHYLPDRIQKWKAQVRGALVGVVIRWGMGKWWWVWSSDEGGASGGGRGRQMRDGQVVVGVVIR